MHQKKKKIENWYMEIQRCNGNFSYMKVKYTIRTSIIGNYIYPYLIKFYILLWIKANLIKQNTKEWGKLGFKTFSKTPLKKQVIA